MARRSGSYKSEKRKKEVLRQQKQEKKRQKRLGSKGEVSPQEEEKEAAGEKTAEQAPETQPKGD